jgi:hypothetical protein
MPINLYSLNESRNTLAYLCDDVWDLPSQIPVLEKWLTENESRLAPGDYVADVGFMVREAAAGGGAVVGKDMMRIMSTLGMELYLSEYRDE